MHAVLDVLRLIPGAQPSLIDSSCCGMAGSFGYEAAHHEVVDAHGRAVACCRRCAPQPDAIIVADGTSCRHQIADGASREALHVAQVLALHLADDDLAGGASGYTELRARTR